MIILENNDLLELEELIKIESDFIKTGFKLSKEIGVLFFSNSINSFKNIYLKKKYNQDVIPPLSTEYRYFTLGLLNSFEEEQLESLIPEFLIPKYKNSNVEVILNFILDSKENKDYSFK